MQYLHGNFTFIFFAVTGKLFTFADNKQIIHLKLIEKQK